MTPVVPASEWARADRILDLALDCAERERSALLDRECGDDPQLRRRVERLLAHAGRLEALDRERSLSTDPVDDAAPGLAPGDAVGRYRIVRELGRGGMAVVFLAERADGELEQRVALKVLKRGTDTDEMLRRFALERRILASLEHPSIARVLDAGASADGRPFLAMEYVEGVPLDAHADGRRLSIAERLQLFLTVARAVAHAHGQLVLHRDLKPSNILVGTDGVPKLLDFGIAKLLDEAADEGLTRTGMRLLTPAYASPEQLRGEPVGVRSDVFQLGLLLRLLLAGPGGSGSEGPSQLLTRLSADALQAVATARRLRPTRLRQHLRGDLETIVRKTLHPDPARRYSDVTTLVDDVERHLRSEPVRARPDGLAYVLSRFLRRHRVPALAATASIVLLAALGALHALRLTRERDRAERAAVEARTASELLRRVFELSAPTRSLGEQITARELLDRTAAHLDTLTPDPALRAEMQTVVGGVYRELALYPEATRLLDAALAVRRKAPGDRSLPLARTMVERGRLAQDQGAHEQARVHLEEALALQQSALGPDHPEVGGTLDRLGLSLSGSGQFPAARRALERALEIRSRALPPDHPDLGRTLKSSAMVLRQEGEFTLAQERLVRAVRILQTALGDEHPEVGDARAWYADTLRFTGQPERARAEYLAAIGIVERAYGPDHPEVTKPLRKLANLLSSSSEPAEARKIHRRILGIQERAFGPEHASIAGTLNNLGVTHLEAREWEQARPLFERSTAMYERTLGPEHESVATPLRNLALVLSESGDPGAAIPHYRRALALRRKAHGERHVSTANILAELGEAHRRVGALGEAEPLLDQALALGRRNAPYRYPEVTLPTLSLARVRLAQRRYAEAEALARTELEAGVPPDGKARASAVLDELQAAVESARDVTPAR
jgi:serine/threonine-protein kinase